MFVLIRAITYASLFISLFLIYIPSQVLARWGIVAPAATGALQFAGMVIALMGTIIALWCIGAFALIGKGTPAPFDPPRKLVVRGPYRFVRNPMYIGAGVALLGATLYYESLSLFGYTIIFLFMAHMFAVFYEEPVLTETFGEHYQEYCSKVRRWLPQFPGP